jgi:signal transduction histidine kinase
LFWDARLRKIWALPPEGDVSPELFLAWLSPDDRARLEAAREVAFGPAGDGRWEVEYLAVGRLDGVPRHVAERGRVEFEGGRVEFEGGRVVRVIGTVVDVTAQHEAEAVLARDRTELARLVRERTRDLLSAQARLTNSQRMEALGQISSGVAHDFNNVLQAVQGGAALLERRPDNVDGVRRLARMLSEAAARGTAITRRLLALSRQGELRPEPIDPGVLLRDLKEAVAHSFGAAVEIRTEIAVGLPPLLADKGQLETALVNLATNAREAMPEGGTLTLSAALDGGAATGLQEGGPWLRLRVADTGVGMDATTLERASEPFFSTKGGRRGTGLGLAMARGFAEQSGGAMAIESEPGRGTAVSLWLPAAEITVEIARPAAVARSAAGLPHVLLVDDEALVCEITAEQLESEGFAVMRAASGPAALALLEAGETVDAGDPPHRLRHRRRRGRGRRRGQRRVLAASQARLRQGIGRAGGGDACSGTSRVNGPLVQQRGASIPETGASRPTPI